MSEEQTVNVAGDSTPEATLAAFATVIRTGMGQTVAEERGPVGGYEWTWNRRGVWVLRAGELLTVEPHLVGPAGKWQFGSAALANPDLVLLFLRLSDALPEDAPAIRNAGRVYGRQSMPATVVARPVLLLRCGPMQDGLQPVSLPSGQQAMIGEQGGELIAVLPGGRMGRLAVPPFGHLPAGEGIPATLYDQGGAVDCEMLEDTPVDPPHVDTTTAEEAPGGELAGAIARMARNGAAFVFGTQASMGTLAEAARTFTPPHVRGALPPEVTTDPRREYDPRDVGETGQVRVPDADDPRGWRWDWPPPVSGPASGLNEHARPVDVVDLPDGAAPFPGGDGGTRVRDTGGAAEVGPAAAPAADQVAHPAPVEPGADGNVVPGP